MTQNGKVNILLLDDDPYVLKPYELMLKSMGVTQVAAFDNGPAALAHIDHSDPAPNLILLDLNMPGMDGLEFVRHLVERRYSGSFILISGEDLRMLQTAESLIRAHGMTVHGSLRKPVTLQALSSQVNAWVHPETKALTSKPSYSPSDMRTAILGDKLVSHYQPQVLIATGEVLGVEALIRWQHPVHGLVLPEHLIEFAEESGLINEITAFVLHEAFAQLKSWQEMGLRLRMSINITMDDLASLEFADLVDKQATAAGVESRDVMLEVTESRLMKDLRTPLEVLARLRMKRFNLSIDDFGTGHSSLTQLRTLPFDELKIDKSFVHGAAGDRTIQAIFDASLRLANQLDMVSVAEGVEDRSDWEYVHQQKCRVAQGNFIAEPMPAAELPGWIDVWKKRLQNEFLCSQET